jgi:signal transduction histidine kinase
VTGRDHTASALRRAYDLGAVDFLFKPLDPDILRAKATVFTELDARSRELRRAQAEAHDQSLEAQRRRLQTAALIDADRRKDEFLAVLAHELRNPLAPLRTSVELLARDPASLTPRMIQILNRQVFSLEAHRAADRARARESVDLTDREVALLENGQHGAAHEAGRADHGYIPLSTHIPTRGHPFSAGRTLHETPRADKVRGPQNEREIGP